MIVSPDIILCNHLLLEFDTPFIGIEMVKPSLDDVFIRLTGEFEKEVAV